MFITAVSDTGSGTHFTPYMGMKGYTEIILCMHPANERRRYIVTSSLIGWAHTQHYPCRDIHNKDIYWWDTPL